MVQHSVLITDDVHPMMIEAFKERGFDVHFDPAISYEEVKKIIPSYTGLIINSKINCNVEFIDLADRLKFIGRLGSGREVVDIHYAQSKGIGVYFSPEANKNAVAEHALAMLLALSNQLVLADAEVRNQIWRREARRGWELAGRTIGIIGYGHTGSQFAKKLSCLDMQILVFDKYFHGFSEKDRYVHEVSLEQLLLKSDIISLHLPLANETYHYVDEKFIRSCKQGVIIINTSRGNVVDTSSLVLALEQGRIGGACLDVFENEKPSTYTEQESGLYQRLFNLKQVVLSPHIAGWTHESKFKMASVLIQKIFAHIHHQ
jgi:D-3-phosphoglycerate dehydrogenase